MSERRRETRAGPHVDQLLQVPAPVAHPELLWRGDCVPFRLARLPRLHALDSGLAGTRKLHLRLTQHVRASFVDF